ncbi:YycH family regulatory protein [Lederbergia panacisoli]|uniref:YycH family regulatory protein n=1 Tax=Lederbergia panacisoli TaxID=1255251 RepID=UPI00214BC629|nr:two-component system activity regulator YycH [Lederbergia panacisoli]MCR2822731.1 two-component system activity regulator YycH [Lederbergia panacisoli]
MKYETVKSIVLATLVALSAFLTWNLWTYKPKYELNDTKYVHEMSVVDNREASQREASQIIKPLQVLFHIDEKHFGTVREEDISELLTEVGKWNIYDLGSARILDYDKIQELAQSNNRIELIYPDSVPFDLYKGAIHFEADVLPNASFDRIVIKLDSDEKDGPAVYFISTNEGRVYKSNVNPDLVAALLDETRKKKSKYDEYKPFEMPGEGSPDRIIFLTTKEKALDGFIYRIEYINPEKFKDALFRDPKKVRKDPLPDGEQYTDDRSVMNVDFSTNMIDYINPGQNSISEENPSNQDDVLKRSIDFVNEHRGWTDNYRYFGMAEYEKKTTFQLFLNNYPVFNEQGMTNIRQYWGSEEIFEYKRPFFSIQFKLPEQTRTVLPSGEDVMNFLLDDLKLNPDVLESILIGYRLSKDSSSPEYVSLEPSWYYLYGGSWIRFDLEEMRGDMSGLE